MKYLGFILAMALVAGQVLADGINGTDRGPNFFKVSRGLSDDLRNYLEEFKIIMREGNKNLGVPKLDPLKQDFYDVELNTKYLSGVVKFADFKVFGLSHYKVRTAEVSWFKRKATVGLTWSRLDSFGDHKLNARVSNDKFFYGNGEYNMTVTDLSFDSVISVGIWGGLSIKSMQSKISLGGCALSMSGLSNSRDSSDVFSQIVSDMVPQLVRDYQREITEWLNGKVMVLGNKLLGRRSLSDLSLHAD